MLQRTGVFLIICGEIYPNQFWLKPVVDEVAISPGLKAGVI